VYASDGRSGIYKGFGVSVVGLIAYRATYFGCFDTGKAFIFPDMKKASMLSMYVFAQLVTTFASFVSYPFDTIRRRLMMQSSRRGAEIQYSGSRQCIANIIKKEGYRGFYKGFLANFAYWLFSPGASLLVLESKLKSHFLKEDVVNGRGSG
jgi:solute carrier family 25 (adenine nucleotide translocator) protein 4/5/6/31